MDPKLGASRLPPGARPQHKVRHRGDRGQRLAAESERDDRSQIVGVGDLAGGVPLEGEPGVGRIHSFAVVLHADLFLASQLNVNGQAPRPGVDGVLDQLLDHGGWPFNDFAGGNLIGEVGRETVDLAHVRSSGCGGTAPASGSRSRP